MQFSRDSDVHMQKEIYHCDQEKMATFLAYTELVC